MIPEQMGLDDPLKNHLLFVSKSQNVSQFEDLKSYITGIVNKGGPELQDYLHMDNWMNQVSLGKRSGLFSSKVLNELLIIFGEAYSESTMQGFAYNKPHGYPGDFEIIDRIYTKYICKKPHCSRWDVFFQSHAAAKAVRNRKDYFKKRISRHANRNSKSHLDVLNIASGPCRDLYELFESSNNHTIEVDCVEQDGNAIEYAKNLCKDHLDSINFIQCNAFRFRPQKKYDVIWSAGLFDYFNNEVFEKLIVRLLSSVKKGGELIIGNFSVNNPSRDYMDLIEWKLYHRSEDDLRNLAIRCGMEEKQISIGKESQEVNLFLQMECS